METNESTSNGRTEQWRLLARRTREMTEVMLLIAEDATAGFAEDVSRVARVRQFLCCTLAGRPRTPPPPGDLLFVLGALIEAFEPNCRDPEVRAALEAEIDELLGVHGKPQAASPLEGAAREGHQAQPKPDTAA